MEHLKSSEATTGRREARSSKRRRRALGSVAAEAQTLHGVPPSPEHIGHMLMSAETRTAGPTEKAASKKPKTLDLPPELKNRNVETLSRAELMNLSDRIMIDGSSLRQIYETHLVGERGLRRLIAEYLRGGDLKQALRLEIVERERDFERDPAVRDMTPDETPDSIEADSRLPTALDKLLKQADLDVGDRDEEAAFFKARARYEVKALHQHKQRRRTMDIGLGLVILVLFVLVVALLMSHT